jgi:hypothetical protein
LGATIAGLTGRVKTDLEARPMTDSDYARKLDQLDHLLNDPEAPMQPSVVWELLAEIAHHDAPAASRPAGEAAD